MRAWNAPIEYKPVDRKHPEFPRWETGNCLPQRRERGRLMNTGEREMRRIRLLLERHADPGKRLVRVARQILQGLAAVNAGPEDPRRMRIRKPAQTANFDIAWRAARNILEDTCQFVETFRRPRADELRGD